MIYINKQLEQRKNAQGIPEGKAQELFPHLCNERGEIVRTIWIELDVERGELSVETYGISTEQIADAVKWYISNEKERYARWRADAQKRLAALEAVSG